MRRSRGAITAIAAWLAVVAVAPAHAGPLEDAKAAVEASDYLKARAALAEALAAGAYGRDDLAELHRLSGVVAGALGDAKAATAAFERALALSPKLALPPGTSPKIVRPFTAAQQRARQRAPLEIRSETASSPPAVTVAVISDPLAMIARVRVAVIADGRPEQTFDRAAAERTTIELPAGARLDVRVAVLDEHGNRLAELGSREVPIVIVGEAPPPPRTPRSPPGAEVTARAPPPPRPPRSPRPAYLRWWVWGGAALAFGGAATYFGVDALLATRELDELNRDSAQHSFDEAKDVEGRARRSVLLANVGYGVAGVLAAGAVVLYLTAPRAAGGERRVAISPARGGGAIVLGGRF